MCLYMEHLWEEGKWEVAKGQRLCMPHVPSESYTI